MKLNIDCKACGKTFELKSNALTRSELEDQLGAYFKITCPHCGKEEEYHVNDVYATGDDLIKKLGLYTAILIAVLVVIFALDNRLLMLLGAFVAGVIYIASRRTTAVSTAELFNSIEIKKKEKQDSK